MGAPGLFLAAFLDSSFLSLPEISDILMVTSSAARPELTWLYALSTVAGSVSGCLALYWVARRGGEPFLVRRFGQARVDRTRAVFDRFGVLTLAVPAMLPPPVPLKIFVLAAGGFGYPLPRFVLTLAAARLLRFAFWGAMGAVYGTHALDMLRAAEPWIRRNAWMLLPALAAIVMAWVVWWLREPKAAADAP